MGASHEIIKPLREYDLDDSYGLYLREGQVNESAPQMMDEWYAWLEAQRDPGNYESYKVIRGGQVEWVTDTFMPPFLCRKLKEILCG
jgi:hypothetical protein